MPHVILFVDDEPEVLELLRRAFPAGNGREILCAGGAEEALGILARRPVDLLVTDQRMPRMSGIELIERARRLRPDLCAILLTAHADPRDVLDAINRGEVYRYVVKPWETADLRHAVEGALERARLCRERAALLGEAEPLLREAEPLAGLAGPLDRLARRALAHGDRA